MLLQGELITLEMGVSSTFGCIPIDVVLANTIPSSGWKLSKSLRDNAIPPIASASSTALSSKHTQHQEQKNHIISYYRQQDNQKEIKMMKSGVKAKLDW